MNFKMTDNKTNSQKAIKNLTDNGAITNNTLYWKAKNNPAFAESLTGKLDDGGALNIQYNVPIKTSSTYTDESGNQYPVYELYLKEFIPADSPGYHISNISKYIKDETKELKILNFNYSFKDSKGYIDCSAKIEGANIFIPTVNLIKSDSLIRELNTKVSLNPGDILWMYNSNRSNKVVSQNITIYSKLQYAEIDKSVFDDLNYTFNYNVLKLNSIIKDPNIKPEDTFNLWYSKEGSSDKVLVPAEYIPEYNEIECTVTLPELLTLYNVGFVINDNIYSNSISLMTSDNPYIISTTTDDGKLAGAIQSLYENNLIASPKGITPSEMDKNYIYYEKKSNPYISYDNITGFNKKAWDDGYGNNSWPQNCIVYDTNNKVWRNMQANGTTPELKVNGRYIDDKWPSSFNNTPYLSISLANNDDSNPSPSYSAMLQHVSDTF